MMTGKMNSQECNEKVKELWNDLNMVLLPISCRNRDKFLNASHAVDKSEGIDIDLVHELTRAAHVHQAMSAQIAETRKLLSEWQVIAKERKEEEESNAS